MAYYFIIHPANDNPVKRRKKKNTVLREATREKKIVTLKFIYRKGKKLVPPNRCTRSIPRDILGMFVDTLSVSGHDVCGFVCIVSSLDPSGNVFHAQVYHGDEDGVVHITQRERGRRERESVSS